MTDSHGLASLNQTLPLISLRGNGRKVVIDQCEPYNPRFPNFRAEVEWRLSSINRFWYSPINEDYHANFKFMQGYAARWIKFAIGLGYQVESTGTVKFPTRVFAPCVQLHRGLIALWKQVFENCMLAAEKAKEPEVVVEKPIHKYHCMSNTGACVEATASSIAELAEYFFDLKNSITPNEFNRIDLSLAKREFYSNPTAKLHIRHHADKIVMRHAAHVFHEVIVKKVD